MLLQAAFRLAACVMELNREAAARLDSAATYLGLAFQALDDMRDQPGWSHIFPGTPDKDLGQDQRKASLSGVLDLERLVASSAAQLRQADVLLAGLRVCTAALRDYLKTVLVLPRLDTPPAPAASTPRLLEPYHAQPEMR